ncbi:methylated-DNA--[protein]-cysteine S-methyltransferase [Antarcticibacterium sp. 1MA-6-2]|uniref:methylated-DNA--[protein]-cysteine S-methyltransferase n=1 Tax=Antarcticibacterium sp. 1MA-6-2 TaxID=2908210 RepID=UPI002882F2B2|nr:methylated-DNA--[protein]-cysteine S-methyltransferase [Antarcticibacterium sp. 1MA-6-2]
MKKIVSNLLKTSFNSPLGLVEIEGDSFGISKIQVREGEVVSENQETPVELEQAVLQFKEYFAGERKHFSLKLNPSGTDFQKKIWLALQEIPFGTTCSYLQLSKKIGDIKAIRAVAAANGKNPLWIVVPCHRVIGTDGSLLGYAGGLWRKKWLLEHRKSYNTTDSFLNPFEYKIKI